MKKLVKKPVFKKNQMIITALAGMIAIAGYLNYAGTDVNPSLLSVDSEAVEDVAETDLAQDISAEDTYARSVSAASLNPQASFCFTALPLSPENQPFWEKPGKSPLWVCPGIRWLPTLSQNFLYSPCWDG